ncbi:MAG: M3 family oligoendopeptidase [Clostridiales bacterium]|nr:M3 family oligoendopeptidase [Clostridiales bacterium]
MELIQWKLENIYKSPDDEKLINDIEKYSKKLEEINAFCKEKLIPSAEPVEVISEYIQLVNEALLYNKISAYLNFILSVDSGNKQAAKLFDRVCAVAASSASSEGLFGEYLKGIDIDSLEKNRVISEHLNFLKTEKAKASHSLGAKGEELAAKLKTTGSKAWEKLWESLTSGLTCDVEGENIPLAETRSMAYNADGNLRKKAYEAELKAYEKIAEEGNACLNAIKGEVINETGLRGYSSPLEKSAFDAGIDLDILKAMFKAVDDNIDGLNKFYKIKADYLGKDKLPFYDLFAPVGKSELKFTFEEASEFVKETYSGFSEKMGKFAEKVLDSRWVDPFPHKGKVGGAYCEYIKDIEESRIMMNFSGNFEDIITLSHEMGHGYQNETMKGETPINSDYPMTLAETASTFCENLAFARGEKILKGSELLTVKESRLSGELQSIIDIYSRFLFEDSFFEERKKGSLSLEETCDLMIKAQKKAYAGGLDENILHPYMWLCKPHYYDSGFNYYNYPYAFGDLFARSLFAMYEDMGQEFIPLYDKILSSAGRLSVEEVGRLAGIDFKDKAFWEKGIKSILKDIDELEELIKEEVQ